MSDRPTRPAAPDLGTFAPYTGPMARSLDRGWRIVWLALAWLGGVAWQLQQAALWPPRVSALVGLAALGLAVLALRWPGPGACAVAAAALALAGYSSTDWRAAQEEALGARLGDALASGVMLVPLHGSRTSSVPAFIDAVAPRVAVVQAAYRSRFGHPAADVVERYRERGVEVVRSDRCGAWSLPADAGLGTCQRQTFRRYWHHPAGLLDAPPD